MTGLEEGWIQTDERAVRYPSLPAGDYRFEVLAQTAEGVSSLARLWFRSGCSRRGGATLWSRMTEGVLVLVLLTTVWRWRVRQLLQRQQWLESAVDERRANSMSKGQGARGKGARRKAKRIKERVSGEYEP